MSRNPRKVNDDDELVPADLLDAARTAEAVKGSEVVYFDNTYMYPQDARVLKEDAPFEPVGRKGRVRAPMAAMVLDEMARGEIPVLIARAPEFYGPGKAQSFTNALVIENLEAGKKPRVPVRDDARRTLIWTPDASRALALLGNTPDAFGQTWHLPCCDDRSTYRQFVALASEVFGRDPAYSVVGKRTLAAAGPVSKKVREIRELLPRYEHDNLFDSTKFKRRFPEFVVTSYREGLGLIEAELAEAMSHAPDKGAKADGRQLDQYLYDAVLHFDTRAERPRWRRSAWRRVRDPCGACGSSAVRRSCLPPDGSSGRRLHRAALHVHEEGLAGLVDDAQTPAGIESHAAEENPLHVGLLLRIDVGRVDRQRPQQLAAGRVGCQQHAVDLRQARLAPVVGLSVGHAIAHHGRYVGRRQAVGMAGRCDRRVAGIRCARRGGAGRARCDRRRRPVRRLLAAGGERRQCDRAGEYTGAHQAAETLRIFTSTRKVWPASLTMRRRPSGSSVMAAKKTHCASASSALSILTS